MSRRSQFSVGIYCWSVLAVLASVPSFASTVPVHGDGPWNLTLFHTNDTHSYFLPRPAVWRDDGKMVGGVIPLAWHLDDQRKTTTVDLFVDAGDFMTGNPVCNLGWTGNGLWQGEATAGVNLRL